MKPLYLLYYRYLYGRQSALARQLGARVEAWEQRTGRGDAPMSPEQWDSQYRDGTWDFLHRSEELARYGVIATYLHHLCPNAAVLDVGCGEGILRDVLAPLGYRRYTGVDVSQLAVERAQAKDDPRADFHAADAEAFSPEGRYQAVVFNESVYYFREPLATVRRYREAVENGGVVLVSMFETLRSRAIARQLRGTLPLLDELRLSHRKGTWWLGLFRE